VGGADSSPTLVLGDLCCTCQGVTTALSHTRITHTPPTHSVEAPASFCCSSPKGGPQGRDAHCSGLGLHVPRRRLYNTISPNCAPRPASLPRGQRLHAGDLTPSRGCRTCRRASLSPRLQPGRPPLPIQGQLLSLRGARHRECVGQQSFCGDEGPLFPGPEAPDRGGVPVAGTAALTLPGPRESLARAGDGCGRVTPWLMPCPGACSPSPPWWEGEGG